MKSVGPKVWNAWKGGLLDELYWRTLSDLKKVNPLRKSENIARCKERLTRLLATVGTPVQISSGHHAG
jgi:UTP:GlnB (protein PII) uridylyltransferase